LHIIIYRIRGELKLIEKIDAQNRELETGTYPLTQKNYQKKVGDLLGIKVRFKMKKRAFKVLASLYEGDLFFGVLDISH
jgi:hypothetical protein